VEKIDYGEAGWVIGLVWLSALEEVARDFHGTRPKVFCQQAYEHAVQHYLHILGSEYGIHIAKADSIKEAVENYIEVGVIGRLFKDASDFELKEINPYHLEINVFNCKYLKSCQALLESGFSIRDLTCARIGCFRAAVQSLASIECDYAVTSLNIDDHCGGYIERS
jgi:hypothetical protein